MPPAQVACPPFPLVSLVRDDEHDFLHCARLIDQSDRAQPIVLQRKLVRAALVEPSPIGGGVGRRRPTDHGRHGIDDNAPVGALAAIPAVPIDFVGLSASATDRADRARIGDRAAAQPNGSARTATACTSVAVAHYVAAYATAGQHRAFAAELKGQVQRTGTAGKLSNDIDMSFTGANAAQIKNQASEYLARRLGVSNSPKEFQRIMMADLFTDPRRMHAYDMLPAAVRERVAANQAAKQEQLIWNRRLYEAVHEGDEALATEIRSQMQGMGISEFRYRPLSGADVSTLSSRVDSLWGELEAAQTAGNMGRVERLSGQIGEAQAMINTAEGGGYFSAGGVRRFVTERPGEPGFGRLPGGAGQAIPSAERLTAILDQLPKLDHAALQLTGSTDDVVSAVRGIGKYGGRLQEVIAEAGLRADGGPWESLARQCEQLKRAADSGTTLARMATGEAEAVIREARAAFSQLLSQSDIALQYVRQATQIPNIANAAARMAYMTVAHVRLMRAVNFILGHLEIMARAVRTGSALADMPAAQGTPAEPSAPPAE